jgi:hypothetical protein
MTATTALMNSVDENGVRTAAELRRRAGQLRAQADHLGDVVANSYRRRASELEMQAWVVELQSGVPDAELHRHAA